VSRFDLLHFKSTTDLIKISKHVPRTATIFSS